MKKHPSRPTAPPPDSSLQVSDAVLQQLVVSRLADLGQEFPIRIHVEARAGEVHLRGAVASTYEKLVILHVINSLQTVRAVHDHLVVGYRFRGNDLAEQGLWDHLSHSRPFWGAVLTLVLLIAGGTWHWLKSPPALKTVQTLVRFDGKPPVGAVVTLHPRNPHQKIFPYGSVQQDGMVRWNGFGVNQKIRPGEYAATVTWNRLIGSTEQIQCGPNLLPAQYASRETSPLRLTIKKSDTGPLVLELKK